MYIFLALVGVWTIIDLLKGCKKAVNKNKYLLKNLSILSGVIIILFLFGPFFLISPIKIGYSSLKSDGFTLFYPTSHKSKSYDIYEMAKIAVEDNRKFYKNIKNTRIVVGLTNIDMLRLGSHPRANGSGTVFGIVIRESKATSNIIAHEMSHKNLAEMSNVKTSAKFPRWFDEGLASYIGKMDYYKTEQDLKDDLDRGTYREDIAQWKGIGGIFQWLNFTFIKPNPRLIYGQTYLMVKYLFEEYGQEKVYNLVLRVSQSNFDQTFIDVFGITVNDFHKGFIRYIEKLPYTSPLNLILYLG